MEQGKREFAGCDLKLKPTGPAGMDVFSYFVHFHRVSTSRLRLVLDLASEPGEPRVDISAQTDTVTLSYGGAAAVVVGGD